MTALEDFQAFDVDGAALNVWTFRKSQRQDVVGPIFTGRWVAITAVLEDALKAAVIEARAQITETIEYDILAQNNEGSALTITTAETYAGLIVEGATDELATKKATKLQQLQNTSFYSVKMVSNGKTLHAISRTDDSWKTKKSKGIISVTFSDDELELEPHPAFSLSRHFDLFVLEDHVIISDKKDFEVLLNYKQGHENDFVELQAEPEFADVFTDLAEIATFVGTNKMQLRRASAIRQKGHYKNADFLDALRTDHANAELNINYDVNGRIIPCGKTCPQIFQALLDHRLMSLFSKKNYDVPSAATV